jgi:hypothetical protein
MSAACQYMDSHINPLLKKCAHVAVLHSLSGQRKLHDVQLICTLQFCTYCPDGKSCTTCGWSVHTVTPKKLHDMRLSCTLLSRRKKQHDVRLFSTYCPNEIKLHDICCCQENGLHTCSPHTVSKHNRGQVVIAPMHALTFPWSDPIMLWSIYALIYPCSNPPTLPLHKTAYNPAPCMHWSSHTVLLM